MKRLSPTAARKRLDLAIYEAGNAKAYADRLGISKANLSAMVHGKVYISGAVARDLRLRRKTTRHTCYLVTE